MENESSPRRKLSAEAEAERANKIAEAEKLRDARNFGNDPMLYTGNRWSNHFLRYQILKAANSVHISEFIEHLEIFLGDLQESGVEKAVNKFADAIHPHKYHNKFRPADDC